MEKETKQSVFNWRDEAYRMQTEISEMKKENASLQSEIDRLNQENEGMRKEIMKQGDTIVSLGKVLLKPSEKEELSEMKKERQELIRALEEIALAYDNGYVFHKRITVIKTILSRIKK